MDNSSSMIEKAKSKNLDVEFLQIELDELFDIKFDIIFSNACLQWIKDHHTLLPRLFNMLNRGGVLSVSFPINHDGYFHHILKSFIKSSKYSDKLANIEPFHTLDTSKYHDILSSLSSDFEIFETIYYHRLNSHEEILQWYKGSGLRAYLQVLNESQSAEFEADLLDVIKKNYSVLSNNEVLLKIPRVIIKIVKV